ncbi:Der1-like family-domain-containing protein [Phialemonium atrogriseum]|uniref:Derlin n=1 Tax=Phialemonium atrogriseum TaxID=1093897 RepID=A0AAJ0C556_9PEZI|nr:Der1-like family-domain-containing protein [Phialemonium atrogriseum]KAK1770360.1 Der1-like family-domain-containing protein [Phialemonium atrogriseum]
MSELIDAFWQKPPFARTLAMAAFVTSIGCYFGMFPFHWFHFEVYRLLRIPPEIWRPVSSFFLTTPKLGIILDPYHVFQYMSELEVGNPRFARKEDLIWYLITVGTAIIALNQYFTGQVFYLQGLIMSLCYTSVQDRRGEKSGFFFFTVPSQVVPYCLLLATLLMSPEMVPLQISGLFAAHMYDFLTRIYPEFGGGPNLLPSPAFLSRFVTAPRVVQRAYGTAFTRGSTGQASGTSTGSSTGGSVLPDSWRTRGTGHRLGGD